MIYKAKNYNSKNHYTCADLDTWIPSSPVDIVHSMEVAYYLKDPFAFLQNVYNSWLIKGGVLILGLDFYKENAVSHSWPEDCGERSRRFTDGWESGILPGIIKH